MDITVLVTFLTGGSLVASLVVASLKKLLKDVSDRWGALATQILLFVVCLLVASIAWSFKFVPANILGSASMIFAGAMVLYEVGYKAIWQSAIKGV